MSRKLAEGPLPAHLQARGARLPAAPRPLKQHKPPKQAQPVQPAQPGQPDKPAPPPKPLYPEYAWQNIHANTVLIYCRDTEAADSEIAKLPRGPLGFDLEWKPIFKRGMTPNRVALVQLANESTILLLQISAMSKFPSKLSEILGDPNIVKAGVGIQYDVQKLYEDWGISTCNCVDLSLLARTVDNARWKGRYAEPIGLARLVETYEQLSLPKGRVQRSNWELQLSNAQQQYAANDAHSGLLIYTRLAALLSTLPTTPLPTYYTFDLINGHLVTPTGAQWFPSNPDYDPGPPPPPKPPKEKDKEKEEAKDGEGELAGEVEEKGGPSASSDKDKDKDKGKGGKRGRGRGRGSKPRQMHIDIGERPMPVVLTAPAGPSSGEVGQAPVSRTPWRRRHAAPPPRQDGGLS